MTQFCPLCKKVLLEIYFNNKVNYFCQTRIKFEGKASISHYIQDHDEPVIWYAPPYKIQVNDKGSRIYEVINEDLPMGRFARPEFKFIFETNSKFKPTDPEKTVERIKKLIPFS